MNKNITRFQSKIEDSFNSLFSEVDEFISELKLESSEEILNGSVSKAQELLSQIVPYESFYESLKDAKVSFENIGLKTKNNNSEINQNSNEPINDEKIEFEEVNESEEIKTVSDDLNFTSQEKFRIPILKALIFLGGSADENEVTEFVKKDMKNKLTNLDFEIPEGEDKERWLSSLYFETATMTDEGLLNNEVGNKKWEIAQKGIDYLGKYGK